MLDLPKTSIKNSLSTLNYPVFLLSFPLFVDNAVINNVWMEDFKPGYDYEKAYKQFMTLYRELSKKALVYLLPSRDRLQDQVFVSNLAAYLPHLPERNIIIVSNFTSDPRKGEDLVGVPFFNLMGYTVVQPPTKFEGEAELKYLYDNIYIGGYGQRTEFETFIWLEENYDMNIIKVQLQNERLYHLDCSVFPLDEKNTLVVTSVFHSDEIKQIEKYTNIIDIPKNDGYNGATNCVRLSNKIYNFPMDYYPTFLETTLLKYGYELQLIDLSEFLKSGAALSCFVMHLNYQNRQINK